MTENISPLTSRLSTLANFRYALRQFLRFSEKVAEEEGVSVQHYLLLQVIATAPAGAGVSISVVAERMILRHNSAVELVDRATQAGLVERTIDTRDLRRSLVVLTPRGAEVLARLVPLHLAELDAQGDKIVRAMELLLAQSAGGQAAAQRGILRSLRR